MKHIGKVAEHLVLAELIQKDVEAYFAISFRQEHYDITVIRPDRTVGRVQVKATELQNKSTNNSVSNLDKDYDYLVLVVFETSGPEYFVLTKQEVTAEFSEGNQGTIYTSMRTGGVYVVKDNIKKHKNEWHKIIGAKQTQQVPQADSPAFNGPAA